MLRVIDTKDRSAELLSIDSFICEFELACKMATELDHSYALNCSCHSFLSDLPLFCSLQLPDRISTITEGVLFFLIGSSLF